VWVRGWIVKRKEDIKVIIQIPCYNEESTLGITLSALPSEIPGVAKVEWMVVDDGSTDRTVDVAKAHGVHHIIKLPRNKGLARAFAIGLEASLREGADIIVNTDGDNQYCADDIPRLIEPILLGKAEIVVGARSIAKIDHFSRIKKYLHRVGSWVVRLVSKTNIPDTPSGFRAMSRNAAMQLNVFGEYTYTLETIIQAGQKGMAIVHVPIRTNDYLRPSRLIKSTYSYVMRSIMTIFRIFVTYRPFLFFTVIGILSFGVGFLIGLRFLYFFFTGAGAGHVQSLILSALLLGTGFLVFLVGLLADSISVNRQLLEKLNWRVQEIREEIDSKTGA
jgi:glycosyltransferase involved in cell wall biosynthesis